MSSSPTLRRRRLARRLYELREEKGFTTDWVSKEALRRTGKVRGWSASKMSRLEGAEWRRLKIDDVRLLLDIYGVEDQAEREACVTLAREANQQGWWAPYEDILGNGQFVGLESEANAIKTFQTTSIPGLLQTEDYARAVIHATGIVDEGELARRVEARMIRKNVFNRANPPHLWATIDASALLRIPPEHRAQLEHLLRVGEQPNVGIQVMPHKLHAALSGQFVIMSFDPPDLPIVYLEAVQEEVYLEKPAQITRYQHVYDHVQAQALSVEESRAYIQDLLT